MFSAEVKQLPWVRVRAWLVPGGVAVAGALLAFAVASWTSGPLLVSGPTGVVPVPIGAVLLGTAVGLAAAVLLVRLAQRARRPRRLYLVLVTVGLLLSTVPPTWIFWPK